MKIGDKINLVTASGEKHIGTVFKVFPKDILTLTILRPGGGGITQKYHKISKQDKKTKKNLAYWTSRDSKAKKESQVPNTAEKVTVVTHPK